MSQVRISYFGYRFLQHEGEGMPGDRLDTTRPDVGLMERET